MNIGQQHLAFMSSRPRHLENDPLSLGEISFTNTDIENERDE